MPQLKLTEHQQPAKVQVDEGLEPEELPTEPQGMVIPQLLGEPMCLKEPSQIANETSISRFFQANKGTTHISFARLGFIRALHLL